MVSMSEFFPQFDRGPVYGEQVREREAQRIKDDKILTRVWIVIGLLLLLGAVPAGIAGIFL